MSEYSQSVTAAELIRQLEAKMNGMREEARETRDKLKQSEERIRELERNIDTLRIQGNYLRSSISGFMYAFNAIVGGGANGDG